MTPSDTHCLIGLDDQTIVCGDASSSIRNDDDTSLLGSS